MYNKETQKDLPVSVLGNKGAPFQKMTVHFDRFKEYGVIISLSEEGLREGIRNSNHVGYSTTIERPYKSGEYYHANYSQSRSCD